jgi:diaminopropionate ammonia-lyase
VSQWRADRIIEANGGKVIWSSGTYDDAVLAAAAAARRGDGILVPDTTADPLDPVVHDVMAGYALLTEELVSQFLIDEYERPSHMFIQAGVGGLAAAMARGLQHIMQEPRALLIVEPKSAACVARALIIGRPERLVGDLQTSAEMLSCGLASAAALEILRQHNPRSVIVDEKELEAAVTCLHDAGGPDTTVSGAAGLAGFLRVATRPDLAFEHQLNSGSIVLLVATEGYVRTSRGRIT